MGPYILLLCKGNIIISDDPYAMIQKLGLLGEVAVIDLDAALGRGSNKEIIQKMCRAGYRCRVGGGIRDFEIAKEYY